MNTRKTRRTTANLPSELLKEAMRSTGQGITETIIEGLKLIKRSHAFEKIKDLRGKVAFEFNVEESRERSRS